MTRNFLTLLTVIGLFWYSPVLTAQEKFPVTPRFEPGKYVQTMATSNDMAIRVGDLEAEDGIPMIQKQTQKLLLEVSRPDEQGTQKMKITFAEIKMNQTVMGMEMVYDSTDKDKQDPNLAPMFNAMLGSEITFDLTKDGKAENHKGFDELWEKMAQNMPGTSAEMFKAMKENMGDEMLSNMAGNLDYSFGKEPRAVGEQWTVTQSQNIPVFGKSEIESAHTLKSVKDNVAVIDTVGKMKMQDGTFEMGPMKLKFEKGDMNIATTTSLNIKTGLAFETKGETKMDITAAMDMPVNNAQQMKMRISSKAVSSVTIEKME
jgi:hypothetical protein